MEEQARGEGGEWEKGVGGNGGSVEKRWVEKEVEKVVWKKGGDGGRKEEEGEKEVRRRERKEEKGRRRWKRKGGGGGKEKGRREMRKRKRRDVAKKKGEMWQRKKGRCGKEKRRDVEEKKEEMWKRKRGGRDGRKKKEVEIRVGKKEGVEKREKWKERETLLWMYEIGRDTHARVLRSEKGCRIRVAHVHSCSDCVHTRDDADRLNYAFVIRSSYIVSIKLYTVTPLRRCGLVAHERGAARNRPGGATHTPLSGAARVSPGNATLLSAKFCGTTLSTPGWISFWRCNPRPRGATDASQRCLAGKRFLHSIM